MDVKRRRSKYAKSGTSQNAWLDPFQGFGRVQAEVDTVWRNDRRVCSDAHDPGSGLDFDSDLEIGSSIGFGRDEIHVPGPGPGPGPNHGSGGSHACLIDHEMRYDDDEVNVNATVNAIWNETSSDDCQQNPISPSLIGSHVKWEPTHRVRMAACRD